MFKAINKFLSGYKTYIAGVVGILSEVSKAIEAGDITRIDIQAVMVFVGMMTVRAGITKAGNGGKK